MKWTQLVGAVLLVLVGSVTASEAVDIINKDNVPYKLNVTEKGVTKVHELLPLDDFYQVCGRCLLSIEDNVDLSVQGQDLVVIKDGRLKVVKRNP